MLALLGALQNMSAPAPLVARRDYEAYLRGPALAVTHRFGTVDAYRMGGNHIAGIAEFPAPQDAHSGDFGIAESGRVAVKIADMSVPFAGAVLDTLMGWRNELVDLELVTRRYRADGSHVETVNERRGVVKGVARQGLAVTLDIADMDRSALEALIPSKTFTIADWPKLFVDHVGRPIPQGVGTVRKMPLVYLDNTLGAYKYGGPEVIGAPGEVLTVYRDGRIVSAAEYSVGTATSGGNTILVLTFAAEQRDQGGGLYAIEADIRLPGSRLVPDEIRRLLQLLGGTVDAPTFDIEALWANLQGIRIDAGYVTPREGIAILQDHLMVARAQLKRTPAGTWGIFVDRPRDVALALNDQSDECRIDEIVKSEVVKTMRLEYRPSSCQRLDSLTGKLSRTCTGVTGEKVIKAPYIGEHEVADRFLSYMQKRENAREEARGSIHGVQLAAGDLVSIASQVNWNGSKIYSSPSVTRAADRNEIAFRLYDETVYVYTPGTLPADATNGYVPDYSQTLPLAPTGLVVVSQGTSADTDGKVTAFALIRAVPPAVNWQTIMVVVKDTTTLEQYIQPLLLNAGNYELTMPGLRPNRPHTVEAWAVNSNNLPGFFTAPVPFTSANNTSAPAAPGSITVTQANTFEVAVNWAKVNDVASQPKIRRYVVFEKLGAGAFTEVLRTADTQYIRGGFGVGQVFQYKVRAEDINGNESADSSTASITAAKQVDDTQIIGGGVSGVSIANAAINQGRSFTGTGGTSVSVGAGSSQTVAMDVYSFFPNLDHGGAADQLFMTSASTKSGAVDQGRFALRNQSAGSISASIDWRKFNA